MPLDMNDPQYLAEETPQSIRDMEEPLCDAYGVGLDHFGAKGNEYHYYGFHRSRNWILLSPDSRYGTSDYSVQGTRNHGGDPDWICAFDFTPGAWGTADNREKMIQITQRVYDAARNYDPRLGDLYEFAGTLDGKNVITFFGQGGAHKTPFDITHLDHGHGSLWRDGAANDHSGLVEVILGKGEDNTMSGSFGPVLMRPDDNEFPMVIPPVSAGAFDPRETVFNIGGDLGLPAHLRIWVSKGADGSFRPITGSDGVVKVEAGKRLAFALQKDDCIISVLRVAGPDGTVKKAAISFGFERK